MTQNEDLLEIIGQVFTTGQSTLQK